MSRVLTVALVVFTMALTSCSREERRFHEPPPVTEPATGIQLSELHPGMPSPMPPSKNPYEASAWAVAEGKRLYESYNCVGCHFHGGGGIGPALMDANWIYGSQPEQIYSTIVEGRPNGMPSYRGKIPEFQVWEIVAYVRSLSGQLPADISPSRSDHMAGKKPEQAKEKEHPPQEKPAEIKQEQKR
jgi:cytochrome c oxidase cbb3-type subunit III